MGHLLITVVAVLKALLFLVACVDGESNTDRQPIFSADAGGPYYAITGCELEVDGSGSQATALSGPIVNYTWDFGDGTIKSSDASTSTHIYWEIGEFNVTLTIESMKGRQATDTTTAGTIHVHPFYTTYHEITKSRNDYIETSRGKMKAEAKKHKMWDSKHKFHAYRFEDTFIQPKAEILRAALEMKAVGKVWKKISGQVYAENVGDASPFVPNEPRQLSNAPRTRARVEILDPPRWDYNQYNVVADVTPVIQEIVDRDDFAPGNAIKLILAGKRSPGFRKVGTYDSGAPAKLSVYYQFDPC